ncbi:MAG: imidazole glycerol phosphate synthase cyclase subunit [Rhizobium sp.]|nr:imidazole glycerol phosphate synthase cyclase subunit [Rhizobium sp.]MDM8013352.1 imidazole glycerol phosphate synthase cyclase subunit [Rhizobium sp.]
MIKKRIIPKFLIRNGRLVKGIEFFDGWREAGNPISTAKVYDSYGVDEMIFLDIDATPENRLVNGSLIERVSEEIFMPFTVGGGVKTLAQVEELLRAGADKVCINSAAIENLSFVSEAASRFGDQCIVVAIDYRSGPNGNIVYGNGGRIKTTFDAVEWALRIEDAHAGEVMMTSIDRDGTMGGYDLDMIHALSSRMEKPLIASSGAGSLKHCLDALEAGASAITISSMFLFTDHSPIKVRSYLATNGLHVRSQSGSRS